MSNMPLVRFVILIVATIGAIFLVESGFLHPKFVSVQLITFVSIISASVLAALNGLVFASKSASLTPEEVMLQDRANSFWIAFLYIAISAAFITLVGAAANWKTLDFKGVSIDLLGDLSAVSFSILFILIFFDFAPMIQHALKIRSKAEINSNERENVSFEMPDTPDTKY